MAKSAKLVSVKKGRVLLVRRRRDRYWMFPGGRKRNGESATKCLRREIKEELPKLKLGPLKLWKEVKGKNRLSGRKMSDAIFLEGFGSFENRRQTRDRQGRLAQAARHQIDANIALYSEMTARR